MPYFDGIAKRRADIEARKDLTFAGRVVALDPAELTATLHTPFGKLRVPLGTTDRVGGKRIVADTFTGEVEIPF